MEQIIPLTETEKKELNERGFTIVNIPKISTYDILKSFFSKESFRPYGILISGVAFFSYLIPIGSNISSGKIMIGGIQLGILVFLCCLINIIILTHGTVRLHSLKYKHILQTNNYSISAPFISKVKDYTVIEIPNAFFKILEKAENVKNKSFWRINYEYFEGFRQKGDYNAGFLALPFILITFTLITIFSKPLSFIHSVLFNKHALTVNKIQILLTKIDKQADNIDLSFERIRNIFHDMNNGIYSSSVLQKELSEISKKTQKNIVLFKKLTSLISRVKLTDFIDQNKFQNWTQEKLLFPLEQLRLILEKQIQQIEILQQKNKNNNNKNIQLANTRLAVQKVSLQKEIKKINTKIQKINL